MGLINKKVIVLVIAVGLVGHTMPAFSETNNPVTEVSGEGIIADFVVLRPLGMAATACGCVFFIATLPFTVWTKERIKQAGHKLVVVPGKYTFVRPLGALGVDPESY